MIDFPPHAQPSLQVAQTFGEIQQMFTQRPQTSTRIAGKGPRPDNGSMDTVSRPELDAKLETVETRLEGQLLRIDDQFVALRNDFKASRTAVWAGVATTIGAVLAALAYGTSMFDTGRDTEKLLSETRRTIEASLQQTQQKQASFELTLQRAIEQQREARETTDDLLRAIQAFEKVKPPAQSDKFIWPPSSGPEPYPRQER